MIFVALRLQSIFVLQSVMLILLAVLLWAQCPAQSCTWYTVRSDDTSANNNQTTEMPSIPEARLERAHVLQ